MLYDYDLTPLPEGFEDLSDGIIEDVLLGYYVNLDELLNSLSYEVEDTITEAIEEEHPDLSKDELEDLIGEALEDDYEEVALALSKNIRDKITDELDSVRDAIESALTEFDC